MDRFPVEWKGMKLSLGYIDNAVKEKYCAWLYDYLTDQACARLARKPGVLAMYLDDLFASKPWWGAGRLSPHVQKSLEGQDGGVMYTRLLFGETGKALSDADVAQLIEDKEAEQRRADEEKAKAGIPPPYPQVTDYTRAMEKITEHEFPKVESGSASGTAPTVETNTTAIC